MIAFIQRAFSALLLLSFLAGLALPGLHPPDWLPAPMLGGVLFIACARITSRDLAEVRLTDVLGFGAVRFLLVPLLLWFVASRIAPHLAPAFLLLGLLPTGVTSTAITSILRGNPALALGTTILSTALAPLTIPLALGTLVGAEVEVDVTGMARTLIGLLLVPTALWFGIARHSRRIVAALDVYGSALSVLLICTIAALVANGQRERILADPGALVGLFAIGCAFYVAVYGLGIGFARNGGHRQRVGWAIASGNNNIVLGVTLAVLHLPEHTVTLLAWDLAWITGLSAIQPVLRALDRYTP